MKSPQPSDSQPPDRAPLSLDSGGLLESLAPVEKQLEGLQTELSALREEIQELRRRDVALNFYMQRIDEELRLAARLQQDFLPKILPELGKVRFHTLYRPAGYVSGDLYDVMRLDEAHVGFYLADAVGHGIPAALLTMFIKNALVTKQITPEGYRLLDPSETMSRLNEMLVEQNLTQATFATAVYGTLNTQTLVCRYARAGHPEPMLMRGDGRVDSLEADGGLLGIFPGEIYSTGTVQLESGDRLFIFSDGIEVAFADDQVIDTQKWRGELIARKHIPTPLLLQELSDRLDNEKGSLAPKDDLSVIVVEIG